VLDKKPDNTKIDNCFRCGKENKDSENKTCVYCGFDFNKILNGRNKHISYPNSNKSLKSLSKREISKCFKCGKEIVNDDNEFCTFCGYYFNRSVNPKRVPVRKGPIKKFREDDDKPIKPHSLFKKALFFSLLQRL
jgi:ribosomal protein L37E